MKRIIIALCLISIGAFFTTKALAGEWGIVVHGASMHFNQREGVPWNQANDGFGLRYAIDKDVAVQIGHYRNSQTTPDFNFFTNYGIVDYTPFHFRRLSVGMFAGMASGYDDYNYWYWTHETVAHTVTRITQERPIIPVGGLVLRAELNQVFSLTTRVAPNLVAIEGGIQF
jgi:hypothetical protein